VKKISVIIPAYNEERGIGDVLKAVCSATLPSEIVVVSDGSVDKTAEIARAFPVKVLEQQPNKGKAAAMHLGVESSNGDILCFIDADIIGLTPELVDALLQPVVEGRAEVSMGIFQGGKFSTDWAQKMFPFLTGQRAMPRSVWEGSKVNHDSRYGVEVHLTKYMAKHNLRVENVILKGCTQYFKEQKTKGRGIEGFGKRLQMVWDIAKALFVGPTKPRSVKKKTLSPSEKLRRKETQKHRKQIKITLGNFKRKKNQEDS